VNRQAQAVMMLLFGGAILRASLTDMYLRYVEEGLRPFLIVAGAVLVAAAVMTLWYDIRDRRADAGHDHGHHEPRVGWLLILPVLGLLLVTPPALGSYAAGQSGTVLSAQATDSQFPPLPAGDPVAIALVEYATRAVFDEGRGMPGRTLKLTGFISTGRDGEPMLTRMVLSCCAADGRPIKIGMSGDVPAGLPPDTWVQILGGYSDRVEKDPVNGADVPYVDVRSWQKITPPKRQYE
jgi:uncharacterized repeat protein (TIGR03943 family)